ncbi:MAG: NAD(P)-dependent oxidoreductase [Limnothrix sp.]
MKIGVLGTGLMGTAIAAKLFNSGLNIIAYNRTQQKLKPLSEQGLKTTTNVQKAIARSDYLILTLSDAEAIQSVLLDGIKGFENKIVIQMGTIAPAESRSIAADIRNKNGSYLEAPVLGSIPQAKTGTLLVMAGGDAAIFEQCLPILRQLGEAPMLIGEVGTAAALKLALNQLIASLTASFSLSLGLVQKEGVDLNKFMAILRDSALYAPTFDKKLQRMTERNFENPNFPTKHLLKDTNLFITSAKSAGLNTDGLIGIQALIEQAIAAQLSDLDYSAIFNIITPNPEA